MCVNVIKFVCVHASLRKESERDDDSIGVSIMGLCVSPNSE